jgi:hypothetical protein
MPRQRGRPGAKSPNAKVTKKSSRATIFHSFSTKIFSFAFGTTFEAGKTKTERQKRKKKSIFAKRDATPPTRR